MFRRFSPITLFCNILFIGITAPSMCSIQYSTAVEQQKLSNLGHYRYYEVCKKVVVNEGR